MNTDVAKRLGQSLPEFYSERRRRNRRECSECGTQRYCRDIVRADGYYWENVCTRCAPTNEYCKVCGHEAEEVYGGACIECIKRHYTCRHCSNYLVHTGVVVDSGNIVCKCCIKTCDGCGEETHTARERHKLTPDYDFVSVVLCETCLHKRIAFCEGCGTYIAAIGIKGDIKLGGCPKCSSQPLVEYTCEKCDVTVLTPESRRLHYSKSKPLNLCMACADSTVETGSSGTCAECRAMCTAIGTEGHHDVYSVYMCRECLNMPVFSWRYKKRYGLPKDNKIRFGLELEFDWIGLRKSYVKRVFNGFYKDKPVVFVHDGSLENGFEVVVDPMTAEELLATELVPPEAIKWRKTGLAGTHIHISKHAFPNKDVFRKFLKTTKVILLNTTVAKVMGLRDLDDYNPRRGRQYYRKIEWDLDDVADRFAVPDRYHWVNITEDTVECRFFDAVRSDKDIEKYIRLLLMLIEHANSEDTMATLNQKLEKLMEEYK